MLQNRVDPTGKVIKTPYKGAWMGNRGVIHNSKREIVRAFRLTAWITCRLAFKGQKLPLLDPNRNTQLFFLDEATSFSAGHRPCAECRREDFNSFKAFWLKGNEDYGFDKKTKICFIDAILQQERIDTVMAKVTYEDRLGTLPDGSFILYMDVPHLVYKANLYPWSAAGYGKVISIPAEEIVTVLTPKSIIETYKAGYIPQISI